MTAEIWQDLEVDLGEMAQFSKVVEVQLRRPDRLRLDVSTSVPKRSFYYDGASLTMLDRVTGFFASAKTPATIDETLEAAEEKLGVTFPLEDLLLSRPFGDWSSRFFVSTSATRSLILGAFSLSLFATAPAVQGKGGLDYANYDVPLYQQIVNRIRAPKSQPGSGKVG